VRKMKTLTMKMETVTLIGKGRFGGGRGGGEGVILDLDKYIFPWQTRSIWGLS
jgi:hypothetical protein